MPSILLSDNGVSSGSAGLKETAASDGALALQTTTAGGVATTALSISNTQVVTYANQPVYTGGTANGVAYLNGSKVLTTGSALVFDGTNLSTSGIVKVTGSSFSVNDANGLFGKYSGNAYLQMPLGGNLQIWKSTTDAVATFDQSGNLGLGVTPSAWASPFATGVFEFSGGFLAPSAVNQTFRLGQNHYYNGTSYIYKANGPASAYIQNSGAHQWLNAPSGTAGNAISFTQAMTLDTSGNLLVGTTDTSMGGLKGIRVGSGSATGAALVIAGSGSANKGFFYSSSAGVTWETVSGAVAQVLSGGTGGVSLSNGATSWSAISDERIKTTLTPFENAAAKVATLRAGTGRYLTDDESVSRSFLIAQDVLAVFPEAVDVQNDEKQTLALRYTDLIPLLTAAIQEQQSIIEDMKTRLAAIESK